MEFERMSDQLKDLVGRALEGRRRLRTMDIEAIRAALVRLDDPYEGPPRRAGFHVEDNK